jgi:hypothetical protein
MKKLETAKVYRLVALAVSVFTLILATHPNLVQLLTRSLALFDSQNN